MKLTSEQERLWRYIDSRKGETPIYATDGLFSRTTINALLKRDVIAKNTATGCYVRSTYFWLAHKLAQPP